MTIRCPCGAILRPGVAHWHLPNRSAFAAWVARVLRREAIEARAKEMVR